MFHVFVLMFSVRDWRFKWCGCGK